MFTARSSGVLLHPTSFPGPYGIGDLGVEARRFVDWLHAAGQSWWQILPLNPTSAFEDGSPYKSPASFAGNPLLICPDRMIQDGLLTREDVAPYRLRRDQWNAPVDFTLVAQRKKQLNATAFERFERTGPSHPLRAMFDDFRRQAAAWLEPYARFSALREANHHRPWMNWESDAPTATSSELAARILLFEFEQFLFHRQWDELRQYASQRGVRIVGDLPIYVADDSADVWADRDIFLLDAAGRPTEVAGVPPDYFSATGQLWNNPIYNWAYLENHGFDWWVRRVHRTLELVDVARLDHFRGFAAYWSVPAGEKTAVGGRWVPGPGAKLFERIRDSLAPRGSATLPLIAEDLGTITPDVVALRKQFDLPGMRVLQFEVLDGSDRAMHVERYEPDTVVYTGTHDNDTTVGWFQNEIAPHDWRLSRLKQFIPARPETIAWDLLEMAWRSHAVLAVAPLQDVMSLGSEARMNVPGTTSAQHPNWRWRYSPDALTPELAERLNALTLRHHRQSVPSERM